METGTPRLDRLTTCEEDARSWFMMPFYNNFCFFMIFLMIIILRAVVQEQVGKVNILAVWNSMQIKPFGKITQDQTFPTCLGRPRWSWSQWWLKWWLRTIKVWGMVMISRWLAPIARGSALVAAHQLWPAGSRNKGAICQAAENRVLFWAQEEKNTKQESLTLHSQCFSLKNSAKLIRRMQKNCIHNALVWNCHHNVAPLRDFHALKWV